jgi:hypothetical protein
VGRTVEAARPFVAMAKQELLARHWHDPACRVVLIGGAIRSGKTQAAGRLLVETALEMPSTYLVSRLTYRELRDSTQKAMLRGDGALPPLVPPEAVEFYRASDELVRLRIAVANPASLTHWVFRRLVDEKTRDAGVAYVHVELTDNAANLSPRYVQAMQATRKTRKTRPHWFKSFVRVVADEYDSLGLVSAHAREILRPRRNGWQRRRVSGNREPHYCYADPSIKASHGLRPVGASRRPCGRRRILSLCTATSSGAMPAHGS